MCVCMFESWQLEGLCVGDLVYLFPPVVSSVSVLWFILLNIYIEYVLFAYLTIELIFQIQTAYGSPLMEFLLFLYIIRNKIWSMWL